MLEAIALFFYVIACVLVILLVLLHNPQDAGMGSVGGGPGTGGGGQHVMERNLDRLTVIVGLVFVGLTVLLARIFT
jgi:preprotein translocase subunit SecG